MKKHSHLTPFVILAVALLLAGSGCDSNDTPQTSLVVNSLNDVASPPSGTMTLRAAIEQADPGQKITFDSALNGGTILLSIVGSAHSILKGEVYSGMTFQGYQDRDYGASALYAQKNLVIDASNLANGITIKWDGGDTNRARVLAVYGNLTMNNVTISSGHSYAEAISGGTQPYTLARGGGLAVWGTARLEHCTIAGNKCTGDVTASRDRGTYGGGIFTLSGGPDNLATMFLTNCTIARNLVEDNPDIAESGQYYYRGGGIYMGGGSLSLVSCTVAENEVTGNAAVFSGKPNMGGGGGCATIGNAHTVENLRLQHSIIVGDKLNGAPEDWFAGSLLFFYSSGYNLIGVVDFSQILVPVPDWMMTSRKHYPKIGDRDGISILQALDVANTHYHSSILSAGPDAGQPAVLWYPPADQAVDRIPTGDYSVTNLNAGYTGFGVSTDDFLNYVILQLRTVYGSILGNDFGSSFGDMTGTTWYESPVTWPSDPQNVPWITFWRNLDIAIGDRLGMIILGDDFWGTFTSGPLGSHVSIMVDRETDSFRLITSDQLGKSRPSGALGDIGAIER
jgi:hypothetical protein